jgi:hypothetical protein
MIRVSENTTRQTDEQLRQTISLLAQRVNQLERLLDGKEIDETDFLDGADRQRTVRFSLANGLTRSDWRTIDIDSEAVAMSYLAYAFGFSISGNVVTVNGGFLFHGTLDAISITGDDITITDDATYIFVTYTIGSGVATLSSSTTLPRDEENIIKWLLYKVTLTDGIASIDEGNIHHLGSIKIPSVYASDNV